MTYVRAAALFAALCLLLTQTANAQISQPVSGVLYPISTNITYTDETLPPDVGGQDPLVGVVGFSGVDANDILTGPVTVTVTFGTNGTWQDDLWVYNGSTINVNGGDDTTPGGSIDDDLFLFDTSSLIEDGKGNVGRAEELGNNTVIINNGTVGFASTDPGYAAISIQGSGSKATINGGTVYGLGLAAGCTATINGGVVLKNIYAAGAGALVTVNAGTVSAGTDINNGATMNITGGIVAQADAFQNGTIDASGGAVTGELFATGGAVILDGATVGLFEAEGPTASAVMNSGTVLGDATADTNSVMTLESGNILGDVTADSQSPINIFAVSIAGDVTENSAQVDVSTGAMIGGNLAANSGLISMDGGTVGGNLAVSSNSTVTLSGGTIEGNLNVSDTAVLVMSGGTISGNTIAHNGSNLIMTGGMVAGNVESHDGSLLTLNGGTTQGSLSSYDGSLVFLSGSADINGALNAYNNSRVSMNGGEILGGVNAYNGSIITFSGGTIEGSLFAVSVFNNAKFVWSGGVITSSGIMFNSLTPGGGPGARSLSSADSTELPIYVNDGGSLEVDGINVSASLLGANMNGGNYSEYQLSGFFGDGTPVPAGADFFVQNPAGGASGASFKIAGTSQSWNVNAGSWSNPANWSPNIIADGAGSNANFSTATAPATVDLDGDRTVGTLTLGGSNSYTIDQGSGGTLYLNNNGAGASLLATGQHQILAPIVAQDNTTIDVELNLSGGKIANSSLTLAGGIISFGHVLSIIERGGAPLSVASVLGSELDIDYGTLSLMPDSTPAANGSYVEGLNITLQGRLDITNNFFTDYYGPLPDPVATIEAYLARGQIYSSTVANDNASQSALIYAIGYTDGNDGLGLTSPGEIDLLPTLAGDAKMEGDVVFGDFQLLSQYFGQSGTSWDEGNFSYGSGTNFGDFQLLSQNFGADFSGLTAGESASLNGFASQFGDRLVPNPDGVGFQLVSVPEPASIGLLAIIGYGILGRRRKMN